ncbi:zinc finger protein 768-like [Acipenser ruthenus]|uniref:zinc finger protein 768-like n=1 Tax=Acipenser ruthenus TaxID=7906 RepID=UPI00274274B8|nr:zinc finger protein 768-like [Acipenser ruthenus]
MSHSFSTHSGTQRVEIRDPEVIRSADSETFDPCLPNEERPLGCSSGQSGLERRGELNTAGFSTAHNRLQPLKTVLKIEPVKGLIRHRVDFPNASMVYKDMSILEPGGTPGDTTDPFAILPDKILEDSHGVPVVLFPILGMSLAGNQGVTAAEVEVDSGNVSRSISKRKASEFIVEELFTDISDLPIRSPKTGNDAAGNPSHFTGHKDRLNIISFPTLLKQLHRIPPDLGENPINNNYNNNNTHSLSASSSASYNSECYIEGDIMEHNGFTLKSYPVLIKLIQTPADPTSLEKASPGVESQEEQSSHGSSNIGSCQNHVSQNPWLVPDEPTGCSMQEKLSGFQNRDSENRLGFPTLIEVDGQEYLARFGDLHAGSARVGTGNELVMDDPEQTQEEKEEESVLDPERHGISDFQMQSQHPFVDPLGLPEEGKTRSQAGSVWETHSAAWGLLDEGILKKEAASKQRPLTPHSFSQTTLPSPSPALTAPERPYLCFACEKRFRRATDLKEHLRVHTGERPFSCPVCCKAFTQASALATHRRIHTGEKPFQCRVCLKRFNSSSNFAKHRRTHSTARGGSPRYPCPFCRRTFREASSQTRHLSRVHGGGGGGGEDYTVMD